MVTSKVGFRGFEGTERYEPVRLLGMGGMGAVYEVVDRTTGSHLALKVMLAEDPGRLLRFKQEFRVMAELHHPHLVRLFELGQHEGQWFFTMELVQGQGVWDLLVGEDRSDVPSETTRDERGQAAPAPAPAPRPKALPGPPACAPEALVAVVAQVADALAFLHGRGLVHRDLKPSNILVDLSGSVRLLDFGLVNVVEQALTISQDGVMVGTLGYLAPERFDGAQATPASDLYSLGCTLFQLLTGELPFADLPVRGLDGRVERPPPRASERVAGVPPALDDVVHQLMAVDPSARPTLAGLRAALGLGEAPGAGGRARLAQPSEELLVGRQAQQGALSGCVARAASGQSQVVVVTGPSGIGKSSLGASLLRECERLGFTCLRGRCYEREQVPYLALDRAVDALTLTLRGWPEAARAALAPQLSILARLFPALAMLVSAPGGGPAAPEPDDPRERRGQALLAFAQLVERLQDRAPVCLVLDDLQWVDEESLGLLEGLLSPGGGRVLLALLFRDDAVGPEHLLRAQLERLAGQPHATTLPLVGLTQTEAVRLVHAVAPSALGEGVALALARQTDGNPFLLRRLAGHVATLAPGAQADGLGEVAQADGWLSKMVGALTPEAAGLLALAAVAGGEVGEGLLRRASGLGGQAFDLAVGELSAGQLLKAVPSKAGRGLDLFHDRIREGVYRDTAPARRAALHRRLAEELEAAEVRDAEALVRHWTGAGEPARRRSHALEAAAQAAAKLAFGRSARLLLVALEAETGWAEAAARWEQAGERFGWAGLHREAAEAYRQALGLWDHSGAAAPGREVKTLDLLGQLGVQLLATERLAEGKAVFERGLALLGLARSRPLPAQLAVLGALRARNALAERVPAAAGTRQPGDARLAAELRFLELLVRGYLPHWPLVAAEAGLRAELLGRRTDDWATLQRSMANAAATPIFLGQCTPAQLERSHAALDRAEALARRHALPLGHELVLINRAMVWAGTNPLRARRTMESALQGLERRGLGESYDATVARMFALFILVWQGDDVAALERIERELRRPHPNFINTVMALAEQAKIQVFQGEAEAGVVLRAAAQVEALLDGAPETRLGLVRERTRAWAQLVAGKPEAVLARWPDAVGLAKRVGAWALGIDRTHYLEPWLGAAGHLLARGQLSPAWQAEMERQARWLAREGVLHLNCMGHRSLALLAQARGQPGRAEAELRVALMRSASNANPVRRWLCLETAAALKYITPDEELERAELVATRHFRLPAGWG
jgi:hypothetical protein